MTDDWPETQSKFRMMVLRMRAKMQPDPVQEVAEALPAHRATVYRMLAGEVQRPSQALKKAVERMVAGATDASQVRQSDATEAPGDSEA